jgi:hypothetical protein
VSVAHPEIIDFFFFGDQVLGFFVDLPGLHMFNQLNQTKNLSQLA